jgi:hypothetical protein
MRGALETMEDEDITIIFLRHALTGMYGFVRDADVYEVVQNQVRAAQPAVTFMTNLESLANVYVAIHNPEHEKWNAYSDTTRRALEVLNLFNIRPIRALMLAIAHKFSDREAQRAFGFLVSLSVRLMIASSTRTGTVEEGLASAAHKIFAEQVTTADALVTDLDAITPKDFRFKAAFEIATVSNQKLARYYLRSLELVAANDPEPWHIPNDDKSVINLEHVLPDKPEGNWPQFTDDQVKLYYRRIGNLCLLRASENSTLKSANFQTKKPILANSPYVLTQQIGAEAAWTTTEIAERQKRLANLALRAWLIV